MATLTTLPEELLDEIIELVLLSERPAPENVEAARSSRLDVTQLPQEAGRQMWTYDYGVENTCYEERDFHAASTPLLCTNKLLYQHTQGALRRLFPGRPSYKLDVLLVNEAQLWPTWLYVPVLRRDVDTVSVTFRVFGRGAADNRAFGQSSDLVWCLYLLLEQFFDHGPLPYKKQARVSKHAPITVKNIIIDVQAGDDEVAQRDSSHEAKLTWWELQDMTPRRRKEELKDGQLMPGMHPKWFASYLYGRLDGLLGTGYHTMGYAMPIYECVNRICVTYAGKTVCDFDLTTRLAEMDERPDSTGCYSSHTMGYLNGGCRIPSFWNWKCRTMWQRRERGLHQGAWVDAVWPTYEEWMGWRRATQRHFAELRAKGYGTGCDGQRCYCRETQLGNWLKARASRDAVASH